MVQYTRDKFILGRNTASEDTSTVTLLRFTMENFSMGRDMEKEGCIMTMEPYSKEILKKKVNMDRGS